MVKYNNLSEFEKNRVKEALVKKYSLEVSHQETDDSNVQTLPTVDELVNKTISNLKTGLFCAECFNFYARCTCKTNKL